LSVINHPVKPAKGSRNMDLTAPDWSEHLRLVGENRDRTAFRDLFDKFAPLIKAFSGRQIGGDFNDPLAEELVQETMIKVWEKASTFDAAKASASTWIFTIARNTRIDLLRKNIRHQQNRTHLDQGEDGFDVEDIWIEDEDEDVFNILAKQRSADMLHEFMAELPQEQSFILRKVYLEDKSHSEIAEELSLPLGTVKSRVRLALSKLRLSVER